MYPEMAFGVPSLRNLLMVCRPMNLVQPGMSTLIGFSSRCLESGEIVPPTTVGRYSRSQRPMSHFRKGAGKRNKERLHHGIDDWRGEHPQR
jgi:hypothetical protein